MAKMSRDWIDAYLEYGIDRDNRTIFLSDDIDQKSVTTAIKGLYYLDTEFKDKPIKLFINSLGGTEYEMFALYDAVRTLSAPVHTIAIGCCMSAAPLLVACGQPGSRYATPNTFFMVHESWDDFGTSRVDELEITLKHYREMGERWASLMELHTKKKATYWMNLCKKTGDTFFNAEKALELGIIDSIWDEKGDD